MEKGAARYSAQEMPVSNSNTHAPSVKRKPLAAPMQAYINPKELDIGTKVLPSRTETFDSLPPRPYNAQPHAHIRSNSLLSRLRTRWSLYNRRTRIVILTSIVLLLALIIGLAAGLAASHSRTNNLPLPSSHGGPYTGDLTYYDPALGACGWTNGGDDSIVAVSHLVFDAVSTGSNPNANPLCGKKIRARRDGKSVDLTVVDRCTGCKATDIDTTRGVFGDMAHIDEGRVLVEWSWLEDVPSAATG